VIQWGKIYGKFQLSSAKIMIIKMSHGVSAADTDGNSWFPGNFFKGMVFSLRNVVSWRENTAGPVTKDSGHLLYCGSQFLIA